jgi:hypothetical protein
MNEVKVGGLRDTIERLPRLRALMAGAQAR